MPPDFWERAGFGLYIHWPFCQAKCPYCDFNSHVSTHIDQNRWKAAYLSEIRRLGELTRGRVLSTVFFGGGTPSLMNPDMIDAILDEIRATWPMHNDPEITMEANPTSVEAGRFREYRAAGVSRLSLGIQSLNNRDLQKLGRLHSVEEARSAFDIARETFDRVSFDLIYARQAQSLEDWKGELNEALSMAADHLSLYQLTIEEGTAFGDRFRRGGLRDLPDDALGADMYEVTQEICEAVGLPAYEISNHSIPGAESRHNLLYWHGGDYGGIGPGAHGRLTLDGSRYATSTQTAPTEWLRSVENNGHGELPMEALSDEDQREEYALMGLRIREGIDLSPYLENETFYSNINRLEDLGFVETADNRLTLTKSGRPLLNAVLRELFA